MKDYTKAAKPQAAFILLRDRMVDLEGRMSALAREMSDLRAQTLELAAEYCQCEGTMHEVQNSPRIKQLNPFDMLKEKP